MRSNKYCYKYLLGQSLKAAGKGWARQSRISGGSEIDYGSSTIALCLKQTVVNLSALNA